MVLTSLKACGGNGLGQGFDSLQLHETKNENRKIMPTYNFICSTCGAGFTVIQPLSENIPQPKCKVCGIVMDRVFGVASVQFKGTGWGKDKN